MEKEKLKEILHLHKMWLENEDEGTFANLNNADLRGANLRGADLRGAKLRGADLNNADLCGANLRGADLRGADLRGANLRGANLNNADLYNADLRGADLYNANLRGADLRGAKLRGADLNNADLDYSCLPLWCGSLNANFDDRQLVQILYHLFKAGLQSKNASKELKEKFCKSGLIDLANNFHRSEECGLIFTEG